MTINASLDKRLHKIVRPRFPLKGALIVVALLVAFKALLFAQLGAGGYALKVDELRGGSIVEQAGAYIMQEEPVTVALGGYLTQYIFQR